MNPKRIIISRTDAIGDVILTLPMAKIIKELYNDATVIFFGKTYTKPIIDCCDSINEFLNYDDFLKLDEQGRVDFLRQTKADVIIHVFPRQEISAAAKSAGIKIRIGATGRLHHWFNCNRLVRMSRRNSDLHEAQLNVKLLKPLGHSGNISKEELSNLIQLRSKSNLPVEIDSLLDKNKFKLILHPKSNASAREWSLENYTSLISKLPTEKFQCIITGGENEKAILDEWHKSLPSHVLNLAGRLTLTQLIALLNACDGIVAASTGPLHISSALGKQAIGIYPPIKPMDPGRWAPIGKRASYLVLDKNCADCRFNPQACHCMNEISPEMVLKNIS